MSDKNKTSAEEEIIEETTAEAEQAPEVPAEEPAEEPAKEPVDDAAGASDKYLRLLAEYDNYRKRTQREKDELYAVVKSDAVSKFLPVFDNLERALAQNTEDEAYRKGVEMIMNQFNKTMEGLGVVEIESLGKTFDPTLHNAVMHVEDESKGENEIVEVFQKGFKLGDKVIRYAMVKVAN